MLDGMRTLALVVLLLSPSEAAREVELVGPVDRWIRAFCACDQAAVERIFGGTMLSSVPKPPRDTYN
jgi:hypothetical protein